MASLASGTLVRVSAARQLEAGPRQIWGATCCVPSGLPGYCRGKLCLKRRCSLQSARGFQHGAEQVCGGSPGSAVLFLGHVAGSAQKWGCRAS